MNRRNLIITFTTILIAFTLISGCIQQDTESKGTLRLQITDKPGDLDITHAYINISMVQVHKSGADDDEENDIENKDEYNDGFIADGNGPYFGEVGEDIYLNGTATGGIKPYNWSWDFGDGNISYNQNATHNYTKNGEYVVNLNVTNDSGNGESDWYITAALIGEVDDEDTSTAGWYTIVNENKTYELIRLQNVTDVLGEDTLPAGKYTQIRLTIEKANITINNNGDIKEHDLKIPSKKVKLINPFWIYKDETTILTLDFDVKKSVHQTGNNKFIMKPTIKVIQG